jgi:hypothetical protein
MKIQIHSKILAIAAAAMIGIATTGSPALARGGYVRDAEKFRDHAGTGLL